MAQLIVLGIGISASFAAIKVKVLAINPSETKEQQVPVKYTFPRAIRKEDIIDPGTMNIDYDPNTDTYYVFKEITLPPKATVTFQLMIADKWTISQEEIDTLKTKLAERLEAIKGSEQYATALLLAETTRVKLDEIGKSQNEAAGDIERKIGLTSANRKTMERLENDIMSLDYLAAKAGQLRDAPPIRYTLEAANPEDKVVETAITHFLPKGVQPDYIASNAGFEVQYDNDLEQYYLYKKEKLEAGQTKRYEIEIKDMWRIPENLLTIYAQESASYEKMLRESKYKKLADMMIGEIQRDIEAIRSSQKAATGLKERIALYQVNAVREAKIRERIAGLKGFLAEVVSKKEFFSVLKVKDPLAELKVTEVTKKKEMSKVQVWTIVLSLLVFLGIFTFFATVFWFRRLGKDTSRAYNRITKPKQEQPQA